MVIPSKIKRLLKKGGYLAGKDKSGQSLKLTNSKRGGIAVGAKHGPEGGIKGTVGTEAKPIEFEGEEIIITAPAVKDNTRREFNGKMMTNREILSEINQSGGGVAFADGGEVPGKIKAAKGQTYKVGGKPMTARQVVEYCGCGCEHATEKMEKGGYVFYNTPKHFNKKNWEEKVNEATPKLNKIKSILESIQKELSLKYQDIKWKIEPHTSSWNKVALGYELYFETKNTTPLRFLAYSIWYNTRRTSDFSNNIEITDISNDTYLLQIYYYPETITYGQPTRNTNPTIEKRSPVLFSPGQIKQLLNEMDKKFTFLKVNKGRYAKGGQLKTYYQAFPQPSGTPGESQTWHLISYPEFDQIHGMFFQDKEDAEKYAEKNGIEIIDYSDFNKYGQLIDAFKNVDNPGHSMVQAYKHDPAEMIKFVQEQATGLDAATRTHIHYPPAYHSAVKMVGAGLVQQAIVVLPQKHKDMLIKAWKGKIVPKELRDAVKQTFEDGGIASSFEERLAERLTKYQPVTDEQKAFYEKYISNLKEISPNQPERWYLYQAFENWNRKLQREGVKQDLALGGMLDHRARDYKLLKATVDFPEEKFAAGGHISKNPLEMPKQQAKKYAESASRTELIQLLKQNDPNGIYTDKDSLQEFGKIASKEDLIESFWRSWDGPNEEKFAAGGPTETRYQIKDNSGGYYSRLGGSEHFNAVADFGLLYDEEEAEDVKDWLQKRGYTGLAIVPYVPQPEHAYAAGGQIETPQALGAALKAFFKAKYDLTILTRYIKTVRGLEGSWYEVSTYRSGQIIPNELRQEIIKRFRPNAELQNWDDISYGNIRPQNISLYGREWKEFLQAQEGKMAKGGIASDKQMETAEFTKLIKKISPFTPGHQLGYLGNLYRSEEKDAAIEIVQRLAEIIAKMPKTYETENQETNEKIVYLHYFHAGSDWYIIEKDVEPEQLQAFGYVILGGDMINAEWGYISIEELKRMKVIELDFYFTPIKFGDLKRKWEAAAEEPPAPTTKKPRPGTFLYGKKWGVPEDASTELLRVLSEKGFSIAKLKGQSVDLFKDGHRFYVNDNGGELNLGDVETKEHIADIPYSITAGIRKPAILASDIQASFEKYYNEPHYSDFKIVGTDVVKFKDKETGDKILNEAPPLYVSYAVSWIGPGYTKALIGQDLPAGWYATQKTSKLPHKPLTLDTLLHYQREKNAVKIISEEITTPNQTGEDLENIDETWDPAKGKILKNLFERYYESHLKEKFGIKGRSFDGLTVYLKFKFGEGSLDFSRNADTVNYSPVVYEKLKALSKLILSLQDTSHDEALKILSGGTTTNPKPETSNYANAYELNKAIEKLLDSKPNDADFTADEKSFLKYYSGYGGLEKFGATGKGLLYEYYTPSLIAEKMWGLAYKYGFKGGPVLEPSAGIGEFIKYAPEQHLVVAHEINKYSARICKILYPDITISTQYFEEIFIKNNDSIKGKIGLLPKYKLVIGNPPYGEFGGKWAGMGEKNYTRAGNYIDYFIFRGLDLLEPGGLLIFIVGAEVASGGKCFLSQQMNKCKEEIQEKSDLLDAYRLPNGVFERTDVLSDIIVLRKK